MSGTIETGLDFKDYLARPGVSKSGLDTFHKCPALYHLEQTGKYRRKQTSSLSIGTVVDDMVLPGRDKTTPAYVTVPQTYRDAENKEQPWNPRTKYCREWKARHEQAGIIVLDEDDHTLCSNIAAAVLNDKRAQFLFREGQQQESVFWRDEATCFDCKGRPDWLAPRFAVDLKTCTDCSEDAVRRAIATYRYHVQAAFYTDGLEAAGHECNAFYFVFVSTEPPHLVNVRLLKAEAIELGRAEYKQDMAALAECMADNEWPGPSGAGQEIQMIDLPNWYYNKNDSDMKITMGGAEL